MASSRHHQPRLSQTEKLSKKKTSSVKKKSSTKPNTHDISTPSYLTTNIHGKTKRQFTTAATPAHILDSGYSSGSGVRANGQLIFHVKSDGASGWNGMKTAHRDTFHASPPLSQPATTSLTIPATVHVTGRSDVEGDNDKKRNEGKIRQLEHEVAVLEQQLAEKTQTARSHVEDVTCMRSELARERAALARVSLPSSPEYFVLMCVCVYIQERQETREAAGVQLRKEKAAHVEQCQHLTRQLEKLRAEKREGDREIGILRASLKGSTNHCG